MMVLIAKTTKEVSISTTFLFLTIQCVYFSTNAMAKVKRFLFFDSRNIHSDSYWNCIFYTNCRLVFFKARFQIEASGVECHSDSDMVMNTSCALTDKDARQAVDVDVHFKDGVEISSLYVIFVICYFFHSNWFNFRIWFLFSSFSFFLKRNTGEIFMDV